MIQIHMAVFTKQTIDQRKLRVQNTFKQKLKSDDLVLIFSGEPIQKPGGLDQTYPFLPHPDYFWISGSRRSHGAIAFSLQEGWVEFVKPLSNEEMLWEGASEVISGRDVHSLPQWIAQNKFSRILVLGSPTGADKKIEKNSTAEFYFEIQKQFDDQRRVKDAAEVQLIKQAAQIADAGYKRLKSYIRPGVTERDIQIEFESTVQRAGSEKFPYETIVGTGTNGAVLHAIPTNRIVQAGELVLIDAGVDLQDYCVDITRVFAASGTMTSEQKHIYDLVHTAQKRSIELCRPGVEWFDVHAASARVFAEGLKDLKVMKGSTDSILESGAISVFFPHGVGHLVGLRVRDVGCQHITQPRTHYGVRLRVDLKLEENFLLTVEPGLYFVQTLLSNPKIRDKYKDMINWSETEKWINFGGIRLEDDILITAQGPDNLTAVVDK